MDRPQRRFHFQLHKFSKFWNFLKQNIERGFCTSKPTSKISVRIITKTLLQNKNTHMDTDIVNKYPHMHTNIYTHRYVSNQSTYSGGEMGKQWWGTKHQGSHSVNIFLHETKLPSFPLYSSVRLSFLFVAEARGNSPKHKQPFKNQRETQKREQEGKAEESLREASMVMEDRRQPILTFWVSDLSSGSGTVIYSYIQPTHLSVGILFIYSFFFSSSVHFPINKITLNVLLNKVIVITSPVFCQYT